MHDPAEKETAGDTYATMGFELAREWGRSALDVTQGATQADIRRAFLENLENDRFAPFEECVSAFVLLDRTSEEHFSSKRLPQAYLDFCQNRLDPEVEDFRHRFFQLPPAERKQEWERLQALLQHLPEEQQKLERLRPALSLDSDTIGEVDTRFVPLFSALQELALATPTQIAKVRKRNVSAVCQLAALQPKDVDDFRRQHPDWCAIDQELLAEISRELDRLGEEETPAQIAARHVIPRPTIPPWFIGVIVVFILMMVIQLFRPELAKTVPQAGLQEPIYLPGNAANITDDSRLFVYLQYRVHSNQGTKSVWKRQSKVSSLDQSELQLLVNADDCSSNQLKKLWPFKSEGLPPVSCRIIREEPEVSENSADQIFLIVRLESDTGEVLYHLKRNPGSPYSE